MVRQNIFISSHVKFLTILTLYLVTEILYLLRDKVSYGNCIETYGTDTKTGTLKGCLHCVCNTFFNLVLSCQIFVFHYPYFFIRQGQPIKYISAYVPILLINCLIKTIYIISQCPKQYSNRFICSFVSYTGLLLYMFYNKVNIILN